MNFVKAPGLDLPPEVAVAGVVLILVAVLRSGALGGYWRRWRRPAPAPMSVADPASQMKLVAAAGFRTVPLLNREEYPLLPAPERIAAGIGQGHRVMAQTGMGGILAPDPAGLTREATEAAFRCINSKRLDFALFDRRGHLALAVEYQGSGHYHATSFMRDAVKREVLRKAGGPLLELHAPVDLGRLEGQVRAALRVPAAVSARRA